MLNNLIHKKYIIYGSSIIVARGLEYFILLFAAGYLAKDSYGDLEFYKKLIEVFSIVFSFGFPALILSYTKSRDSKKYFYVLACTCTLVIGIITFVTATFFGYEYIILGMIFYALFFNGGITPAYILVNAGSTYAAYYKIGISTFFYIILFLLLYYFEVRGMLYPYGGTIVFSFLIFYIGYFLFKKNIEFKKLKQYWRVFKRLLISSFTLVISNFANLMFLYTDIFIIKLISEDPKIEIAEYSFLLNIAYLLLFIPLTLIQVDIDKIKHQKGYVKILNKKIGILVFIASVSIYLVYYFIIGVFYPEYGDFHVLMGVLLFANIFQALSPLFGFLTVVQKKFKQNLIVNVVALVLNIIISYLLYFKLGLIGLAISSMLTLIFRYVWLINLVKDYKANELYGS
ncbi:hypothetical protein ULMS_03640 [Patiriisocius marinistellae]|uniref:Polysaccharide biosynthesis protein C-terminal domain-containing protein n=1 Tax=Patiriisocius marinistellae TaxID=2494560 RepID=A0A5J4FXJ0_9FLAO|nr:hypothetical protein [Patiriisocius marinistellae]GEQ84856.1 hypothetical protein ULMS_03640 [Patiriisocius marinistellae]